MRRTLVLLLLCVAIGPLSAQGTFSDVQILTEDSPPGEVLDASGRVTGPVAELVRELGRRMGVQRDQLMLPWARAYEAALRGPRVAIFETTRTPEREKLFRWVGPINRIRWQFWARTASEFRPKTLDEVRRLGSVTVYINDSKTAFLEANGFTTLEKVATAEQSARMLARGRVATWMASDRGAPEAIVGAGYVLEDFEPIFTIDTKDLYIALSLDFTPAEAKAWQDELDKLKREGFLAKLYRGTYPTAILQELSKPSAP